MRYTRIKNSRLQYPALYVKVKSEVRYNLLAGLIYSEKYVKARKGVWCQKVRDQFNIGWWECILINTFDYVETRTAAKMNPFWSKHIVLSSWFSKEFSSGQCPL
jgi:hypothetical protein